MAANPWKANDNVLDIIHELQEKYHQPRLEKASIVACFEDTKPFLKNKINFGKVTKFNPMARLWQASGHDFCISISADLWQSVLSENQRYALIDLQLSRCEVEYMPEVVVENGKRKPIKDEWGRIQYTTEIKLDDNGVPKWKVLPLDLDVYVGNIRRFGLWMEGLNNIKAAIDYNLGNSEDE